MTKSDLMTYVTEAGFEHRDNLVHLFEGGSKLHGARLDHSGDLDVYGVFIEPKDNLFGLSPFEHFISSSAGDGRRNTVADVDVTLYSLRRWAGLACKGNPTALSFLFAPNTVTSDLWSVTREDIRAAVVSRSAAKHFAGFVTAQMARLLGTKGTGKHGQRDELTHAFGYDTKAGMHAVRLLGEAIELMQTGKITYPRPNRDELISIRTGAWSLDKLCSRVSLLQGELDAAVNESGLTLQCDRAAVNRAVVAGHEAFYS